MRSLLFKSAFRRNAQADSRHKICLPCYESACARQSLALWYKRLRATRVEKRTACAPLTRGLRGGNLSPHTPRARFACACFAPVIIQSPSVAQASNAFPACLFCIHLPVVLSSAYAPPSQTAAWRPHHRQWSCYGKRRRSSHARFP